MTQTIENVEQYTALTEETIVSYLYNLGLIDTEEATVQEVGDGNLNYVFKVRTADKKLVVKQALPYAKVVGESWPLTLKRATIEANALKKHGEFVPHLVPQVYYTNEALAITVMEDLSHLAIARTGLIEGAYYPTLAKDVATYLAQTLFHTSDFALHPFEKKNLQVAFSNPELCKITEDLIFTDPYFDADTNNFEEALREEVEQLWADEALKLQVAMIKHSFLTEGEALLHGDLHTGSIFASVDEIKVIDPEFAFYGPIGFDVGQAIGNLLFQVFVRNGDEQAQIFADAQAIWTQFAEQFSALWDEKNVQQHAQVAGFKEAFLRKVLADTFGFIGTELIRRTIGLAHVADIDSIANDDVRITTKKRVLQVGKQFIMNRQTWQSLEEALAATKRLVQS